MSFQEYSDREMLIIEVAQKIVGDLKTALLTQENVSFVVPGWRYDARPNL